MNAVTFSSYGDPDVLQVTELPDPQAADAHREVETGHGRGKVLIMTDQ